MHIHTKVGFVWGAMSVAALGVGANAEDLANQPGIVAMEFVFESAPFAQCHASTLVESDGSLVAAWFGGTREGKPDVGIWTSRRDAEGWSEPVEVANGLQPDGKRYPCWNPVLFQPKDGPLWLFYKVGPHPKSWWGMLITSPDGGRHWSKPVALPQGILGPIKNKPLALADGTILCPSSTEDQGWRLHFERTEDQGKTWQSTGPIHDGKEFAAIQPTLLTHPGLKIQALARTRQGKIAQCWSSDGGRTWSAPRATTLPNPNSGIDGVSLADGRQCLVYNHTTRRRWPLNVAVSKDGKQWKAALVLENTPGEYSYPAVIQTDDGHVHIAYTWKRRHVKHVVVDPEKIVPRALEPAR